MKTSMSVGVALMVVLWSGGVLRADGLIGNPELGESVYRTNCFNCHGAKGRGDGPVADSLMSRPADLTSELVQKKTELELLQIIREGKPGTSMPAWKKDLSNQQIQDVLAYLRGLGDDSDRSRAVEPLVGR